jgi:hypothetical protein
LFQPHRAIIRSKYAITESKKYIQPIVWHAIRDPVWFTVIKFLLVWLKDMDINTSGLKSIERGVVKGVSL